MGRHDPGADVGVAGAGIDDIYAAMDWLVGQQDGIEAGLARRHPVPTANPARMVLFDLSSSWLEDSQCRWPLLGRVQAAHAPGRGPGVPRRAVLPAGRLVGAAASGLEVGKVIAK